MGESLGSRSASGVRPARARTWLLPVSWLCWAVRACQQLPGDQRRRREHADGLCGASLSVRIACHVGWCVCVVSGLLQALLLIKCILTCIANRRLAHPRPTLASPHLQLDQSVRPQRHAGSH